MSLIDSKQVLEHRSRTDSLIHCISIDNLKKFHSISDQTAELTQQIHADKLESGLAQINRLVFQLQST